MGFPAKEKVGEGAAVRDDWDDIEDAEKEVERSASRLPWRWRGRKGGEKG